MKRRTMKELPYSDRPYEKCLASGPESLTDAELLSVILRTGADVYKRQYRRIPVVVS